jgi:hypothetical protein
MKKGGEGRKESKQKRGDGAALTKKTKLTEKRGKEG